MRARGRVLYAGIATDPARRLCAHSRGTGAKYLRGRAPLQLVFRRELGPLGLALRVEHRLKRLTMPEKEALLRAQPSRAQLLELLGFLRASRRRKAPKQDGWTGLP